MARPKNLRGGAPTRVADEPADKRIDVRVTATEKAAIQAGADRAGKSVSDYVRDLALADAAKKPRK